MFRNGESLVHRICMLNTSSALLAAEMIKFKALG